MVANGKDCSFKDQYLVATTGDEFRATMCSVDIRDGEVNLPAKALQILGVEVGEEVFAAPFHYNRGS
jgi:arginine N-succinyltransferase